MQPDCSSRTISDQKKLEPLYKCSATQFAIVACVDHRCGAHTYHGSIVEKYLERNAHCLERLRGLVIAHSTTVAGNGVAASTGDGGSATSASIHGVGGILFDQSTNKLYISDYYTDKIRMVNASGIISTIAGNGTTGYSGDGGPATSAQLNRPSMLIRDAAGNIYVTDLYNNRVRKISTSGIITTFAGNGTSASTGDGGPATSAGIFNPTGLAKDNLGNIYISDYSGFRIRKVSTTGTITTIAGTGVAGSGGDGGPATSAQIVHVWGIKVDNAGNIYLADQGNNKVRKINTSGIITTIAGTGTAGFSGDGGAATAALLNNPSDIDIDSLGNIYIADQSNARIRKINTSGVISTIAGTGVVGYAGDGGPATSAEFNDLNDIDLSPSGELYVSDNQNNRARKIYSCTGTITSQPTMDSIVVNDTAIFTVVTSMSSPTYQWQQNPGTGFVNVPALWPYSGTTTNTLNIYNVALALNNTQYRCVISNGPSCSDTTTVATLKVRNNVSVQGIQEDPSVMVFPNPAHEQLNIVMPGHSNFTIQMLNNLGQVIFEGNYYSNQATIKINEFAPGVYTVRSVANNTVVVQRVLIQ